MENPAGACVHWQTDVADGFAFVDLAAVSPRSAEVTCFAADSKGAKGFHLVVPAGTLVPGERYQFRLVGNNDAGSSSATTIVQVMSLPQVGSCSVGIISSRPYNNILTISAL